MRGAGSGGWGCPAPPIQQRGLGAGLSESGGGTPSPFAPRWGQRWREGRDWGRALGMERSPFAVHCLGGARSAPLSSKWWWFCARGSSLGNTVLKAPGRLQEREAAGTSQWERGIWQDAKMGSCSAGWFVLRKLLLGRLYALWSLIWGAERLQPTPQHNCLFVGRGARVPCQCWIHSPAPACQG